jgi:integrase
MGIKAQLLELIERTSEKLAQSTAARDFFSCESPVTLAPVTPSPVSTKGNRIVPRRRFQKGSLQLKSGRRYGVFRVDVLQSDGTFKRKARWQPLGLISEQSERAAWKQFQPYLDAVNQIAMRVPKSGITLREFVEQWRANVAVNLKVSSARAIESHCRAHLIPKLGSLPLTAIGTREVQSLVAYLARGRRSRKTVENEEARCFSDEEMQRIIANAREPLHTIVAITAVLGLRVGETLALRVQDLDFTKKIIRVRQSVEAATRTIAGVKSKASSADLPMPKQLETRLRAYLDGHDGKSELLFINQHGRPFSANKLRADVLHPLLDRLGIARGGFHAIRHGVASALLADGASPALVQKQLRHSNAKITLEHYAHVIGDQQRDAVENRSARLVN